MTSWPKSEYFFPLVEFLHELYWFCCQFQNLYNPCPPKEEGVRFAQAAYLAIERTALVWCSEVYSLQQPTINVSTMSFSVLFYTCGVKHLFQWVERIAWYCRRQNDRGILTVEIKSGVRLSNAIKSHQRFRALKLVPNKPFKYSGILCKNIFCKNLTSYNSINILMLTK